MEPSYYRRKARLRQEAKARRDAKKPPLPLECGRAFFAERGNACDIWHDCDLPRGHMPPCMTAAQRRGT